MAKNYYAAACLGGLFALVLVGSPQDAGSDSGSMHGMNMAHMSGHMYMTPLRPLQPGDKQKADDVVAKARLAMAPFTDYRKALAAGYKINNPNMKAVQYHFTNYQNAAISSSRFDPLKPTSLLYKKTPDGGYRLVGVMYTDRQNAPESELDSRIPLSIARWHQHINFCQAPPGNRAAYFQPNAKFGLRGSIITQQECEAAGGIFHPHLFGWMVHIYPFETDPQKMWSLDDEDDGMHTMDHESMMDMKMD
jgi:hypothetical protein